MIANLIFTFLIMFSHATGPIQGDRLGTNIVKQVFVITPFNTPTGVSTNICTIKASTLNPILFTAVLVLTVPFNNGTSATNNILYTNTAMGTTGLITAGQDLKNSSTNSTWFPSVSNSAAFYFYSESDVVISISPTYVGTTATAGAASLIIEAMEVNTKALDTIGG